MMKSQTIGKSDILSSRLVYGCGRIVGDYSEESRKRGKTALRTAIEAGYTHFDHADIYGEGKCEELFSEVLREIPGIRGKIIITSKCGVRKKERPDKGDPCRYDLSKEHIVMSVEGSLGRLNTDFLDLLLLHRPDYLLYPQEVAEAFQALRDAGKVLHFGVSNFLPSQLSLLQSCCPMPLVVNQVEINIHTIRSLLDGTLDQCQELKITPQAWSPLAGVAYPALRNTLSKEDECRIMSELDAQAEKYETENWIVVLAWILKHPAGILPIIGSITPARIKAAKEALDILYSREDWYRLLEARNGRKVP